MSGIIAQAGMFGRRVDAGYNPLALSPNLALDANLAGGYPLNDSDAEAGYRDEIATFPNPGSGSDAVQTTAANRPIWFPHDGRNYAHLPGITGNTLSVPMAAGTYDYLVTYVDDTTATGTISESGGVVTIGPTGANFVNKQIWKLSLSQSGTKLAEFLADGADHGDTTYTDAFSKLWTLARTGDNPAAIFGRPRGRPDGEDDFLELSTPIPLNAVPHVTLCWHGLLNRVSGSQCLVIASTSSSGLARASIFIREGLPEISGRRLDSDSYQQVIGGSVSQYEKVSLVGVLDYQNATATLYKNGAQVATEAFQTAGVTSSTDSVKTAVCALDGASSFQTAADTGQAYIYPAAFTAQQALDWHNYASAK